MLTNEEIYDAVVEIVAKTIRIEKEMVHRESILDELGMDSVLFIESVMRLEDELSIVFDDEALVYARFTDINSLIEYVQSAQSSTI